MLRIKELRNKKNITAREIAESCGISERMFYDYETGKRDIMLSKLQSIANYLKIPITELLYVTKEENTVNEPTPVYGIKQHEILDAKDEVIQSLKRENALLREMLDQAKSKHG
jgi:transcriptional regulator with XRE-family HTH domain